MHHYVSQLIPIPQSLHVLRPGYRLLASPSPLKPSSTTLSKSRQASPLPAALISPSRSPIVMPSELGALGADRSSTPASRPASMSRPVSAPSHPFHTTLSSMVVRPQGVDTIANSAPIASPTRPPSELPGSDPGPSASRAFQVGCHLHFFPICLSTEPWKCHSLLIV